MFHTLNLLLTVKFYANQMLHFVIRCTLIIFMQLILISNKVLEIIIIVYSIYIFLIYILSLFLSQIKSIGIDHRDPGSLALVYKFTFFLRFSLPIDGILQSPFPSLTVVGQWGSGGSTPPHRIGSKENQARFHCPLLLGSEPSDLTMAAIKCWAFDWFPIDQWLGEFPNPSSYLR